MLQYKCRPGREVPGRTSSQRKTVECFLMRNPAGVAALAGLLLCVELFPKWKRLFYEPVHRQAWRKPLVSASSTVEA